MRLFIDEWKEASSDQAGYFRSKGRNRPLLVCWDGLTGSHHLALRTSGVQEHKPVV
jgi:hypothetical protein